jgi:hypothetical protein
MIMITVNILLILLRVYIDLHEIKVLDRVLVLES